MGHACADTGTASNTSTKTCRQKPIVVRVRVTFAYGAGTYFQKLRISNHPNPPKDRIGRYSYRRMVVERV